MILNKWNYETHKYDQYSVPDEWNCQTYSSDMKEIVNCPHCGKELGFGNTYTSLEIHTPVFGFGYGVCRECHEKELERRRKYKE